MTPRPAATALGGKVALVLGSSRGIGAATAHALARAGAAVVLAARDAHALEEVAGSIRKAGAEALAVPADATDARSLQGLVHETLSRFGRLDLAFNNAGSGHQPTPLADLSVEDLDRSIAVNFRGLFLAMKFEIAAMLAGGGGAIVNMSSHRGPLRGPGDERLLRHQACADRRHAERGARLRGQGDPRERRRPGPIRTDRIAALTDEQREPILRAVPMARIGLPEEVAAAVVWLCSDAASFVTGSVLTVDGGRLAAAG